MFVFFSSRHLRLSRVVLVVAGLFLCFLPACAASRPPAPAPEDAPALAEAYFAPEWSQAGAAPPAPAGGADNIRLAPKVIFPATGRPHDNTGPSRTPPAKPEILSTPTDPGSDSITNLAVKNNSAPARLEAADPRKDYLRTLAEKLERNPDDRALRKKLIYLYYSEDKLASADELLKGTEDWDDDEIHLLRALVSYRIGDNNVAMNSIEAVRRKWRGQFQLELKNLLFCREVKGRGNVVRFEKYEFFPGQKEVLLYFEVENFMCKENKDGQFEVAIKASPQLVMRQPHPFDLSLTVDRPVDWPELPDSERLSFKRTYKNFVDQLPMYIALDLPKNLQPGNYALNLVVEDMLAKKQSTPAVLEFRVR